MRGFALVLEYLSRRQFLICWNGGFKRVMKTNIRQYSRYASLVAADRFKEKSSRFRGFEGTEYVGRCCQVSMLCYI